MLEIFDAVSIVLLAVLIIAFAVQLYYTFGVFGKIAFYKQQPSAKHETEPVSVIIAARNEYENLQKNLRNILEQDYPDFEVIVVNHCSWDESKRLLEELQKEYKHLKISQLLEQEKYPTGKKFAITIGVKAAKNDILIFTDADCEPASNQWLRHIQSRFTAGKDIVLGFSPYKKYSGILNLYVRFECLMTALFYLSAPLLHNAFMGVGRNMAYRKELFFRSKGFAGHQHIMSGDDDLFINANATANNVAIDINPESFVYTEPKRTFQKWTHQKSRHMTTGKHYKAKHQRFLGMYYASLMLYYASLIALLFVNIKLWMVVAGIYFLRHVSQQIVFWFATKKFRCTQVFWLVPALDFLYVFYLLIFGTKGLFTRNQKQW